MKQIESVESLSRALRQLTTREARDRFLRRIADPDLIGAWYCWQKFARADQLPPKGNWSAWLFLGGRGAGKTRAGAEWVRARVASGVARRIALVGETFADVREVMVDGLSGLRSVHPPAERPRWQAARRRLVWPSGAIAYAFSSEDPESLRGPQFDTAWCDELTKWRYPDATWDMLQFGLRLGTAPQQLATTTPRPIPLLKRLLAQISTVTTHATTQANAANLAPVFLDGVMATYAGTRLGRQELDGELIEDRTDALWTRAMIEANRAARPAELRRIVVAVDPAVTGKRSSDACGIVAAGLGADGTAYVLDDATLSGAKPDAWAARAVALYRRLGADALVAEVNQGGDLVASVIATVDPSVPVTPVRARRGKWLRAEPVAALYAQGRVKHVGALTALEDEMCDFGMEGLSSGRSPDRLDALVWALTSLRPSTSHAPRVHML